MVVEPNVIEFNKALQGFVELSENPLVFYLVLSILGVYVLLLIWARRRDIRNEKKVHINLYLLPFASCCSFIFVFFFLVGVGGWCFLLVLC